MMSLPCDKEVANVDGTRFPDLVYSNLIVKYCNESSCVALTLSGALDGFSSLYRTSRSWKGLVISEQCFYFTPTSWSQFIKQHVTLESINTLNLNHLYWLPGELLQNTIVNMPHLVKLSIKGTKICMIPQVAKILQSCPKIRKLDFSYAEKTMEEIEDGLKKANISHDILATGFQNLESLKISTTTLDPRHDSYQDPWLLVIEILCFCRDCSDLAIEITYTGKPESLFEHCSGMRMTLEQFRTGQLASESLSFERNRFPQLTWMKALKSFVILKLGPYASFSAGMSVTSWLLDSLVCHYLFPQSEEEQSSRPLERLWIQDYHIVDCAPLAYLNPDILKSYRN